jgi:hypothetical protein
MLALAPAVASASAAITIDVTPSVAPNAFGSPSYGDYVSNAVYALGNGLGSYGDSSLPSFYQATSGKVKANQVIVTGFNSWLGKADPGTAFGPAYASELGNRMLFGVVISDHNDGHQFSISDLSFTAHSSDPGHVLDFTFGQGSYNYSNQYVGVVFNADGSVNHTVTSGPNTQLVDEVIGRGSGNALDAYCSSCSTAGEQAAIDAAAGLTPHSYKFVGTYSIGGQTGAGAFSVGVPEPATWATMILGLGAIGAVARRSRRRSLCGAAAA